MKYCFVVCFILSNIFAASVTYGPWEKQIYVDSGDLREFRIQTRGFRIDFADYPTPSYGTSSYLSYTVASPDQYSNFAIVQYVKGCRFESQVVDGKEVYHFSVARKLFGENVLLHFPEFVIDSIDTDPMFNNMPVADYPDYPGDERHGFYKWANYLDFSDGAYQWITFLRPMTNFIYVGVIPGTAFATKQSHLNISLEYRTCIHRTDSIPLISSSEDIIENPIKCFNWHSSHVYDYKKKKYVSLKELHPACL